MARDTLGALLTSGQNSFNLVRLLAALSVVISHSFQLLAGVSAEPLAWMPYTLSQQAVNIFFVLSGMLLSLSIAHNPSWDRFLSARALRILPGLFFCGVIVGWLIGPFATTRSLTEYFFDAHTIFYPILSVVLFDKAALQDVFMKSSQPGSVNAPLWTIKYELLAYIAFSILVVAGLLSRCVVVLAACVVLGSLLTIAELRGEFPGGSAIRFGFCFSLGVIAYQYKTVVRLRSKVIAILLLLALATNGTFGGPVLSILFFAYLSLYAGKIIIPRLSSFCHKTDLSYGIYLYAWPIQQLLIERYPRDMSALEHIPLSLVMVLPFAFFSWFLVEKPALSLKFKLRSKSA